MNATTETTLDRRRHPARRVVRTGAVALSAVPLAAVLAGCGWGDDAEREERGFGPVGEELAIVTDNSDLDLRPGDVDEVEVTARVSGGGDLVWELGGDRLELRVDCPGVNIFGDCGGSFEAVVPADVALSVEAENGEITAADFSSGLHIDTENGTIDVSDIAGPLTMASENGAQSAEAIASSQVEAGAENGDIALAFSDAPDAVDITTENGGVTLELPDTAYDVTTQTHNGEVDVAVAEDPDSSRPVSVSTHNGPISMQPAE